MKYLHLSDLHLASIESKGPVQAFNQDVVSRSVVAAIKGLGLNFDFIVITGDIARAGQADEYEVCLVFCNALLEATGLDRQRLFIVPGNHDVNRLSVTQKHIKSFYAFDDQDEITETFTDPDLFPILMRKFEGFNAFAAKAAAPKRFDASTCWFAETIRVTRSQQVCRIALAGLNSCLFAGYDGDDRQKLALGLYQVNQAQEQITEADLSIALFHHPFFCYHPCDKVCRNLLINNFDLILTGHLHDPSNLFTRDAAGQAVIIGAGAGFETREHHNSFNVVELDTNTGRGKVQFHKYLPDHNRWKKDTDVNPAEDDGSFYFETGRALEGDKLMEAGAEEISEELRTTGRQIDIKDSRAGVIGDGARVEGGIHFKEKTGGIHVADVAGDVTIYGAEAATGKAEALREAYLNRVISDTGFLALKGIDPKAASIRTSTRLNLKAVYTALLTRRADLDDRSLQVKSKEQERLSALPCSTGTAIGFCSVIRAAAKAHLSILCPSVLPVKALAEWTPTSS
ncbi:MAG: metallophosphoesterase [bacterium]|nr:metallophosphoesterase [bacterium]